MSLTLTPQRKGDIFRMLSTKSLYDTGIEFGFDKHYKDAQAVKNAVYRIYTQVLADPQKHFILPEVVDMVKNVVANRNVSVEQTKSLREKKEELEKADFKDILISGRKKAFTILNQKLDLISSSRKKLDDVNVTSLAQVFGIIFDKAQIVQGEATENIAMIAKIDDNLSPEQAMEAILKTREMNNIDKERNKKK